MDNAGQEDVFVYDPDLVAEVCDETRFGKPILPPLSHVRDYAGAGLFTAHDDEDAWGMAHRILMPAFSQRAMKGYFGQMLEIAQNLVGKWEREQARLVKVTDDYTRLTLDTIALSGFGYRFDSLSTRCHPPRPHRRRRRNRPAVARPARGGRPLPAGRLRLIPFTVARARFRTRTTESTRK